MTLDELIQAHPVLQNVECGVQVPPGWVPLVHDLATKLEALEGIKIDQVKSKFGGLRVYLAYMGATHSAEADQLIEEAESIADHTCEVCGNPTASLVKTASNWLTTRCQKHIP